MTAASPLTIIGRAERIELLDYNIKDVAAKVDTGADVSSIWATNIRETGAGLTFELFGDQSPYYTGDSIIVAKGGYKHTRIANSFGTRELRYVIKTRIRVQGRVVNASFTLADRSTKTYPILLGRKLLNGKFLVDVSLGAPLLTEEKLKRKRLHIELGQDEG